MTTDQLGRQLPGVSYPLRAELSLQAQAFEMTGGLYEYLCGLYDSLSISLESRLGESLTFDAHAMVLHD